MNKEAQRIAIAGVCGYKRPTGDTCYGARFHEAWMKEIPDYLNSLESMGEAEKILESHHYTDFLSELSVVCGTDKQTWGEMESDQRATATQRAEAFLKTLGLWVESDENLSPAETTLNSLSKSAACATLKGAGKAGA